MANDRKGAAYLAAFLVFATAVALAARYGERLDIPGLSGGKAKVAAPPSPLTAQDIADFRYDAMDDALRDFLNRPSRRAEPRDLRGALFAPPPGSPLADYAAGTLAPEPGAAANPAPLDVAALLGDDLPAVTAALAAYKAGDFAAGDAAALSLKGLSATLAQWAALRLHPREAGFSRATRFLAEHPQWPAADWLRKRAEEALFGDHRPDSQVKDYFAKSAPTTAAGKLAVARALARDGDFAGAGALVKSAWRDDDLNETLENAVKKEFADLLTPADHKARADRLLYAEKNGAALRAAELAGKDVALLAHARAAANNDSADDKMFASVPQQLQTDPGLLLSRAHMLRKKEKFAEAAAVLLSLPADAAAPATAGDAWWNERRLVARKILDRGDAAGAYRICARNDAHSANARVEAEFHAGWIALRFLNDPARAQDHFERLAEAAETPIQMSRAAYWSARVAEQKGAPEDLALARTLYGEAANYSTTFYGQLARAKIGLDAPPVRPTPRAAEGGARDESVRVIEILLALGEKELAAQLAFAAAKGLGGEDQLAALAQTLTRAKDAKMTLNVGKLASHRGVALDDAAFPSFGVPQFSALPGSASRSVVYAIARQESAFDPKAYSSAGAMGLMQMIESTARHTAVQAGLGFDVRRMMEEPAFNAQLGAAHLGVLLGELKGSYILTFAAYNAGGRRVKEWIDAYGDPRKAGVDPIDWVERIPISETRNYVQRVMENLVVYRYKFGDIEAPHPTKAELKAAAAAQ